MSNENLHFAHFFQNALVSIDTVFKTITSYVLTSIWPQTSKKRKTHIKGASKFSYDVFQTYTDRLILSNIFVTIEENMFQLSKAVYGLCHCSPCVFSLLFCRLEVRPLKRIRMVTAVVEEPVELKSKSGDPLGLGRQKVKRSYYLCDMCDPPVHLADKAKADQHAKEFHQGSYVVCEFCGQTFSLKNHTLISIVNHLLSKHHIATEGYDYYKCQTSPDCHYYSASKPALIQHMMSQTHRTNKNYMVVGNLFPSKLDQSQKSARPSKPSATQSSANLFKMPELNEIVINDQQQKCRKCFICSELIPFFTGKDRNKLKNNSSMREHCKAKHEGKLIACHICKKTFPNKLNYAYHLKTQHSIDTEGYELLECHYPGCDRIFKHKWDLGCHLVRHKGDLSLRRWIKNPDGSRTWIQAKDELQTVETDVNSLDFKSELAPESGVQCDICGHHCTNRHPEIELELHKEIWHGGGSYLCPDCGESFTNQFSLALHNRHKHNNLHKKWQSEMKALGITWKEFYILKGWSTKSLDGDKISKSTGRPYYDPENRKPCPQCHKVYNAHTLPQHMKSHTSTLMCPVPGLGTKSIFFLSPFCEKSLICLEGKSMTPQRGNTILFCSSQQLPRLRLGPSKGFLS